MEITPPWLIPETAKPAVHSGEGRLQIVLDALVARLESKIPIPLPHSIALPGGSRRAPQAGCPRATGPVAVPPSGTATPLATHPWLLAPAAKSTPAADTPSFCAGPAAPPLRPELTCPHARARALSRPPLT